MSTSQTISRLSLFDIIVKIIPGFVLLTVVLALLPDNRPLPSDRISETILLALSIPVSYVLGVLLQGVSSICFPRKKYFQKWMREARENIAIKREEGELIVSGGNHVKSIVLADAIVRFDLDRKYLKPSDSSYDPKPMKGNVLFRSVCMLPIYVASVLGLASDPREDNRVYYGGENFIFDILREHASDNDYTDFMRFQRIYVLHRILTLVACISFLLLLVSILSKIIKLYEPLLNAAGLIVLLVLSFLSAVVFYSGMKKYQKIRDERLLYSYYADKSGSLLVSPKYAPEIGN